MKNLNSNLLGKLLIALGISFSIILVTWIFLEISSGPQLFANILSDDFLLGHGNAQFSEEIKQMLNKGTNQIIKHKEMFKKYHWGAELTKWIGFAATSIVTIIAGSFELNKNKEDSLKVGRFKLIGFLAAIATICTLLATKLNETATVSKETAKELTSEIIVLTNKLKDHPDQESNILLELTNLIE